MFDRLLFPYGSELRYSCRLNAKGKIIYALFGETFPGYLNRFFVNRRISRKYNRSSRINILEIGSANGAYAFWLSRDRKHTVVALESDKVLVDDCDHIKQKLNRNNLSFICADASTELLKKDGFDIVFSTHVLEHIPDDRAALINAFNILKPGGLLIIQVPYGDPHKKPSREEDIRGGHVREGYTEEDLLHKLEHAGFEIISMTGSIGRIGRLAYRFARGSAKLRFVINLSFLMFPFTLALIYLEQVVAFLRNREPSFEHGPLVIARSPGG